MKHFRFRSRRKARRGFSLVEAVLSLGVLSFGFLALAPLMAVGLTGARSAHENRATSRIALALMEEARQGALAAGPFYFDSASNPCDPAQAAYAARSTSALTAADPATSSGESQPLTRLTLQITPVGSPGSMRTYVDVFPTPPLP